MNHPYKVSYLAVRVVVLQICILLVAVSLLVVACQPVRRVGLLVFLGLMLLILVVLSFFCIYLPYRRYERVGQLIYEGYATEEDIKNLLYAPSPTSQRMLLRLWEVLNPSQVFQMNKRQAQYLALQNQINPHFLYNTLESIRSEALVSQLDSVADMTECLASFFRYTISKVENLVSVEEELENCQVYFQIQKYRFGDRLNLHISYDPEDEQEILRCRMPKLSMQPLLENAIIHGTELMISPGELTISLELTKKRLIIRISDNGVGMDDATLRKLNCKFGRQAVPSPEEQNQRKGGLALVNVDERIRLLFGDEYGLHVFSQVGVGTDVELSLPAVTSDRDVKNQEVLQ